MLIPHHQNHNCFLLQSGSRTLISSSGSQRAFGVICFLPLLVTAHSFVYSCTQTAAQSPVVHPTPHSAPYSALKQCSVPVVILDDVPPLQEALHGWGGGTGMCVRGQSQIHPGAVYIALCRKIVTHYHVKLKINKYEDWN